MMGTDTADNGARLGTISGRVDSGAKEYLGGAGANDAMSRWIPGVKEMARGGRE